MMYRQGDVLLVKIDKAPEGGKKITRKKGKLILAEGEVTGHAHAISSQHAQMREVAGAIYLLLLRETILRHEEHKQIILPPGDYRVIRQVEYTPEEIRRVAD